MARLRVVRRTGRLQKGRRPGPGDTFATYGLAWANVSNTPLRSTKLLAYEGGIRTIGKESPWAVEECARSLSRSA